MKPSAALLIALSSLALAACGNSDSSGNDGGDSCQSGQTRCSDGAYQECSGGTFRTSSICAGSTVCSESLGCAECRPEDTNACVGDTVTTCNADGTLGGAIQECLAGQCSSGSCGGGGNNCGGGGTQLIYVVDDASNFLGFDPTELVPGGSPFTQIGTLNCPAGSPLGGGTGAATPFSMSVDRNGRAWVLYNSGEIFHVSTADASCLASGWPVGNGGFELFGMGFVSDSPGSDEETLFISGGDADDLVGGNLGSVNPTNLALTNLGVLPAAEQSPELTGTGDAKLYGYFPGSSSTFVANLDKSNGTRGESWNATSLQGGASAWAFAHWGGRFYIFATSGLLLPTNAVYELDPVTGINTTVINASAFRVVGAGVSTCAPTQID
ncbi:MAG: hypothetical protein GY811_23330 [Myxococcales bacterium]|nr:hypothetical protein [Myxococcales bacterium]